ncbi:diguanylate cyclase [Candidatus Riflebacteria bacterium]
MQNQTGLQMIEKYTFDLVQNYGLKQFRILRQFDEIPELFLKLEKNSSYPKVLFYSGIPQSGWESLLDTRPFSHFKLEFFKEEELKGKFPKLKEHEFSKYIAILYLNFNMEKWLLILEREHDFIRDELKEIINSKDDFFCLIELLHVHQELAQKEKSTDFLYQILEDTYLQNLDNFLNSLIFRLKEFFSLDSIAFLQEQRNEGLQVVANINLTQEQLSSLTKGLGARIEQFINKKSVHKLNDPGHSQHFHLECDNKSVYFCPLLHERKIIGTLVMTKKGVQKIISEQDLKLLSNLSGEIAIAFKKNELAKNLEQQSLDLEERSRRNEVFYTLSKNVNNTLNPESIILALMELIRELLEFDFFAIILQLEGGDKPALYYTHPFQQGHPLEKVHKKNLIQIFSDYPQDLDVSNMVENFFAGPLNRQATKPKTKIGDSLSLPIVNEGNINGVFYMGTASSDVYTREIFQNFSTIVNIFTSALKNAIWLRKTEKLAYTDLLTGLFNHRFFQEKLEEEFKRAQRYGHELSLIFMDVDFFKKFNDQYGHQAGDQVLKACGKILLESARKNIDTPARYGGEEFCIILPETDLDGAQYFAERLRQKIEDFSLKISKSLILKVTASFGVTTYIHGSATDRHDLIEEADQALYKSKENGRNQVTTISKGKKSEKKSSRKKAGEKELKTGK